MAIFVDTSVWYAAADEADRHHSTASGRLRREASLVTSSLVLVESWQLTRYRANFDTAEELINNIMDAAEVAHPIDGDFAEARLIGEKFHDQSFSLVDRTSFAIMRRLGVNRVATLDKDFSTYRYGPKLTKRFQIALS